MAGGVGATSHANAFATPICAKAITLKQAVPFAFVFELCGAIFMGSSVSKTMRKGISDDDCYKDNPGRGCSCTA